MDLHTARGETSIRELADSTGISRSTLHRIDKGERQPNAAERVLLSNALGQPALAAAPEPAAGAPARVREQYPGAPSEPAARRAHFAARTAGMAGVRPVDGVTFGTGKVAKV